MKGPPSKCTLDNPSGLPVRLGHYLEALHAQHTTNHIDRQLISGFDGGQKIDPIEALVGQNGLQPRKALAQGREEQQSTGSLPTLADVNRRASTKPSTSTTMKRLRPVSFLLPS